MTDYYQLLELDRGASAEDIKRAYRRLARQYHPDANAGDPASEERFKQISQAYEVLSDPGRRQRYDQFGDERGGSPFGFGDLGDIMETFFGGSPFGFGGGGRGRGPERGGDLATSLSITLEEAARGTEKQVTIDDLISCERCKGNGSEPGTFKVRCDRCAGTGAIRSQQRTILGTVMTQRVCGTCNGAGEMPASPCTSCGGNGVVRGSQTVTIEIPAGVRSGMSMRVAGRGRAGERGAPAGDLYVEISVTPHSSFDRVEDDLYCTVSVPFTVATLGGEVVIPTLEGDERVRIDAGTQSGSQHKLRGRGAAHVNGRGHGDVVANLIVEVPRKLNDDEREIIAKLAQVRGDPVDEESPGLVSKLKGALRKDR
ncbi:MAG: molecular chaperone DnaJ [Actinomycetota bacterium]|nr:molecular chaperone DnaJ [Actinomycetota bacterium]